MISRKIRMKLLLRHQWPQQRTIVAYLERPGEGQNQTPEVACIGPWHETADHIFICVKVALGAKRTCCVGGWRISRSPMTQSGHGPDRNLNGAMIESYAQSCFMNYGAEDRYRRLPERSA